MSQMPSLDFSISATTRSPRKGEIHGKDYYFLESEDFRDKIDAGKFLEWEEVYEGTYYGTLRSELQRIWSEGKHVVFDVDVEGGVNLKKALGDAAFSVFVKVRDLDVLRDRLTKRGTETEESLNRRVHKAEIEMGYQDQFDYVLINEDLDQAKAQVEKSVADFIQ